MIGLISTVKHEHVVKYIFDLIQDTLGLPFKVFPKKPLSRLAGLAVLMSMEYSPLMYSGTTARYSASPADGAEECLFRLKQQLVWLSVVTKD